MRLRAAAALALSIPHAFAQETVPGDRIYELHTEAQRSCPSLNWHMVASPDGMLTGMVAWDNRKVVAICHRNNHATGAGRTVRQVAGRQPAVSDIRGDRYGGGWSKSRHPPCQHTIRHHPGSGRRSAQPICDEPRLPVPSSLETGFGVLGSSSLMPAPRATGVRPGGLHPSPAGIPGLSQCQA